MASHIYQQLIERAALTALEHFKALSAFKSLKAELRSMYDTFFEANGRPEGRFDQYDDEFLPVMIFTNAQYARVCQAKKTEYNARRRHLTAIRALDQFKSATSQEAA